MVFGTYEDVQAEHRLEERRVREPDALDPQWPATGSGWALILSLAKKLTTAQPSLSEMRRTAAVVLALLAAGCGGGGSEQAATTRESTTTGPPSGRVLVGQNIFFGRQKYFCWVCHSIGEHEGNGRGPDLSELPELAARANRGSVEEFVRDSILHPNAYTEPGFEKGLMAQVPGIPGDITAEQLDALVAFLTASRP